MKECQLQSFHSVFLCVGWCLHKSLWLNYSEESTYILYDNPLSHRSAMNSPPSSKSSEMLWLWTGGPKWLRNNSIQLEVLCYHSLSRSVLTYLLHVWYQLTGTLGTASITFYFSFQFGWSVVELSNLRKRSVYHTFNSSVHVRVPRVQWLWM